jgi:5-methylcytosine-specific restriction protein A
MREKLLTPIGRKPRAKDKKTSLVKSQLNLKQAVAKSKPKKKRVLTEAQKRRLKLKAEFKCQICDQRYDPEILDIHHIYPVKLGGSDRTSNLIVLCPTCHRKADRKIISRERLKRAKNKKRKKIDSQVRSVISKNMSVRNKSLAQKTNAAIKELKELRKFASKNEKKKITKAIKDLKLAKELRDLW